MVDSGLDKSHEHLYKSKSTFFLVSFLFFYSHTHRGCLSGKDLPTKSIPEESIA